MPLFNDTITLGVNADMTSFERDVLASYSKLSTRLKPLDLKFNNGISQPLGKITGDVSQFNKSLDAASARVLAFSASVGIINGVQNAFRSLVRETVEVEKALTDINVVLNTSQKGLDDFGNSLFDIARQTASSFKDVAQAASEFSRQGLSIEKTLKATNAALLLSRISGLDATESVKSLTTAMNGFNKEALDYEKIVNRLASVDSNFAVSTKDIADALTRVGSTADEAGVSFNELVATITAVQQTTSRGGAVIGNALKSIFTRISRESTIQQLRELGVAIDQSQTGIEKLRAISQAVERVDKSTANTIKELAGGVFQINVVTAALGDLSKEYSVYDNALKIANQSTDEAIRRNQILNQTLAALASQAGTNIQELLAKLGKISFGGNLKSLFSDFNGFTKAIIDTIDGDSIGSNIAQGIIQGIGNFVLGPGGVVLLGFFGKIFLQVTKDAASAFKSIYGITSESEKQAQIQAQISQRLTQNAALYEQQLLSGKGLAGIQNEILIGLAREAELRASISRFAASAAAEISPLVNIQKGIITPKASTGFIPAMVREQRDIMAGIGGATPGARPVLIPRFNFGHGVGPIVANSSEKIVENWMGGKGSAVLNQDMIDALGGEKSLGRYGKVRNVAEGFTPNLASYEVAGGKVNLRKRGGDIVLDEILAPFNATGERASGTGIVRQAFDLAIEQGKKLGAENLIVDIINSKVAASMNNNPRFASFGPFGIGKVKLPLLALADGYIPSMASTRVGANRYLKTDAGSFLKYGLDEEAGAIQMGFLQSNQKGDAYKLFGDLLERSRRSGLPISSEQVFPQISDAAAATKDPWQRFLKTYPQIRYRMRPDAITSGSTATGLSFNSIDDLKNLVMSSKRLPIPESLLTRALSEGFIPSLASPIKDAVNRELTALVSQGIPQNRAAASIRIGSSSALTGPKNPFGFGVYNTAQGQTSLKRAFVDHGGQNLKTVGAADGYIPNLAGPIKAQDVRSPLGTQASKAVIDEINRILENISKPTTSEDFQALNLKMRQIQKTLAKFTSKKIDDIMAEVSRIEIGGNVRQPPTKNFTQNRIPDLVPPTVSESILKKSVAGLSNAQLQAIVGNPDLSRRESISDVRSTLNGNPNSKFTSGGLLQFAKSATLQDDFIASTKRLILSGKSLEDAYASASREYTQGGGSIRQLNKTQAGLANAMIEFEAGIANQKRLLKTKNVVENISGKLSNGTDFASLSNKEQQIFRSVVRQKVVNDLGFDQFHPDVLASNKTAQSKIDAEVEKRLATPKLPTGGSALGGLAKVGNFVRQNSLSLAFAGSLATPFLDQGADALRARGKTGAAGAVSTASGALTGASFGAVFGPEGAALGALIGGAISLGKAADGSATKAEELAAKLDKLGAELSGNLNGFSTYIQTQQKLNAVIEEGGRASDVQQVRSELGRVFATITDSKLRADIVATGGDIKKLGEAFAKAQSEGFQTKSRQESITLAAAEKANNTNFFGARTQTTFGANAISDVSRTLIASADPKKLNEFSDALKGLNGDLSQSQFAEALKVIDVKEGEAASLFKDLEKPLNRLLLLRGLRTNLDFAKQLEEATAASVKYKQSLTDLNKTIGTLTAISSADERTQLGFRKNAFSVQQNGAQQAAGLRFFDAGQFAQAQLSTAFQSNAIRFDAGQDRESTRNDLLEKITASLEQDRVKLNSDPALTKKLDEFIASRGQSGNIGDLANQFLTKGLGSGEELKAFSNLGIALNDANNKLASIDDNERSQINILRQNLDALKQRIQIENKVGLLGGAEGQLNFARSGFDRLANRNANTSLQRLGGEVGAFGRNENAGGILEFQKAFGGVDGLDVRKFIPDAQKQVADSIKQSLVEGFGRLNLPIDKQTLDQFDSVSQLSAAKQFERKELTAIDIGQAVGASFKYDTVAAGNQTAFTTALGNAKMTGYTSAIPEIKAFLESRFGLEKERVGLNQQSVDINSQLQNKRTAIDQLRAGIEIDRVAGISNLRAPGRNIPLFSNESLRAAGDADLAAAKRGPAAAEFQNVGPSDLASLLGLASGQLKNLIPSNGNKDEFRKNINDSLKEGFFSGNEFLRTALLTQFKDFNVDTKGNRSISDESFNKILSAVQRAGGADLSADAQASIANKNVQIDSLTKEVEPLTDQFKKLQASIAGLQAQIDSKNAAGVSRNPFPRPAAAASTFDASKILPGVGPLAPGDFQKFIASQKSSGASFVPFLSAEAKANAENAQRRRTQATFGDLDTSTIGRLAVARQNLAEAGGDNKDIADEIRRLETVLLRQAQGQQLTLGRADPRLQAVIGTGGFRQNSQKISGNQAQAAFQDLVKQANDAFVSGFATQSDLTKIGIRIQQGLEDYVRAQIKLGVPEQEARDAGKKLRAEIQKELDQLDIKLPKNKIEEFGQGFKSRTEELQKSFDDLGSVGANTADSLVNGFGDAFFEIASGAQSAGDAVRGMLASVAADLSKFFAKRAFAAVFSAAAGNSNAGSFGGLFGSANGRYLKRANGGYIPSLVMGGERAFSPETVNAYGVDFFHNLNAGKVSTKAGGGSITGGSGYKDDVLGNFKEGTFILQKAAVNKYGKNFLDNVDAGAHANGGKVQKAFFGALLGQIIGGAIQGAVVGGVTAKVTGGDWKKGALLGAIGGGIAGGVSGFSGAKGATGSFGDQFGQGFSNSFSWLGGGSKANANAPAGVTGNGTLPSPDSLKFDAKLPPIDTSLTANNGGFATGIGNQSLTAGQTAVKPSIWKTAGQNLAVGAGLALLSSAIAPKSNAGASGSTVIPGNGSITTYNNDGSVVINGAGGYSRRIDRTQYANNEQLEKLVAQNGGQLPQGGIPTFATGGQVAAGSGSVAYKDRAALSQINKTFAQAFAMGSYVKPKQPVGMLAMGGEIDPEAFSRPTSPFITQGSGVKDDVPIMGKKGEVMIKSEAADLYGRDFMQRLNAMQLSKQDAQRVGVLTMAGGGPVEYAPSDRDKGLFSLSGPQPSGQQIAPVVRGGGGGDTNIEVNINFAPGGKSATVETKSSSPTGQDDRNSIDSQKFASKFKTMFLELVDQEKRPGGSLYKDNING